MEVVEGEGADSGQFALWGLTELVSDLCCAAEGY